MSKVSVSLVVAAVMMVGSSAWADIGSIDSGILHFQEFTTTALNGVSLMHGDQQAYSSNWATLQNDQHSVGECGLFACENQTGFFSQVGNADGYCSLIDLDQSVMALGSQQQTVAPGAGPKLETQSLVLNGTQLLSKADGGGSVNGDQIMSLRQDQNTSGPMNQSSVVFGAQNTCIDGAPGATGAAGNSLVVTTLQEQMVY